jgi:hypothetical protein
VRIDQRSRTTSTSGMPVFDPRCPGTMRANVPPFSPEVKLEVRVWWMG